MSFPELADWVISRTKKAGANDCKVTVSKRRIVEINYRDHKPEVIKEASTQNLYLEVFINNRFAGQSTPDFRPATLQDFITGVVGTAKIMEEDPYRTLPDPKYYTGVTDADLQLADPDYDSLWRALLKMHALRRAVTGSSPSKPVNMTNSMMNMLNQAMALRAPQRAHTARQALQ